MFSHSIKTNVRVPVKSQIDLPAPEVVLQNQTQEQFSLRRVRSLVKWKIPETKYDTLTFKHFFP